VQVRGQLFSLTGVMKVKEFQNPWIGRWADPTVVLDVMEMIDATRPSTIFYRLLLN
jgi:hypothetical protein